MKQLRGEIVDAIPEYVSFRFAEKVMLADKKNPIPREVQQALDVYATYYLGLCHLDQDDDRTRRVEFFLNTLACCPSRARSSLLSYVPLGGPGESRPPVRGQGGPGPRRRVLLAGRSHLPAPRQPAPRPRPDLARPGLALPPPLPPAPPASSTGPSTAAVPRA